MSRVFLRVAKIGGSLFDFAELPTALRCWLDEQPGANVLVAGGGPVVDVIRRTDELFSIGDSTAHCLAVDAMRISAGLLAAVLPESPVVRSLAQVVGQVAAHGTVILDPSETIRSEICQLPHSWDVTSDSIAAYIASELSAHELVLCKSTTLPANTNRSQATAAGLVDKHFAETARTLPAVRWVNLRGTPVTERPL